MYNTKEPHIRVCLCHTNDVLTYLNQTIPCYSERAKEAHIRALRLFGKHLKYSAKFLQRLKLPLRLMPYLFIQQFIQTYIIKFIYLIGV